MRHAGRSPRNRSGQGLVEYALTIALVGVGLTFALLTFRNGVGNTYNSTSNAVSQANACGYGASCVSTPSGGSDNGNNGNGNGNGNGNNGNGNGNNGNGNGGGNGNGNNGNGNGNGNGGGK